MTVSSEATPPTPTTNNFLLCKSTYFSSISLAADKVIVNLLSGSHDN